MKKWAFGLLLALVLFTPTRAHSRTCDDDSIDGVSPHGEFFKMSSGSMWEIDEADKIDPRLWPPGTHVLICADKVFYRGKNVVFYTIINIDEGQRTMAKRPE